MPRIDAMAPLAPDPLITIADGPLSIAIDPAAGGRVAQINCNDVEWLVD